MRHVGPTTETIRTLWAWWLLLAPALVAAATVTYEYDEAGRLKRATFDGTTQITYALDAAGNRTALTTNAPSGALQFTSGSFSQTESQSANSATITVSRTGGTQGAASVRYETWEPGDATDQCSQPVASGTATAGVDYTNTSGTLSWASGDAANKSFQVPLLVDSLYEGNETVALKVCNAVGGSMGTPTAAVLTIVDNDAPQPGTLSLAPAAYNATEPVTPATAAVTVVVTRTGGSDGAVSVNYATSNGTATQPTDYQSASGTLNWPSGDGAAKSFQVVINDDSTINEPNETINLTLSSPGGGAALGTAVGAITIVDSDVGVPSVPANLRTSPSGNPIYTGNFTVRWDDSSGAVSYYELAEDMDADNSWDSTYTVFAPLNSRAFAYGTFDGQIRYRVRACDVSAQCSAWSPNKNVTVCGSGTCQ